MTRTIKVGNKKELKAAILSCKKANCDSLIILNGQTEYLIYNLFPKPRSIILECKTEAIFLQVIKNINKTQAECFLPLKSKSTGFQL